MDDTKQVKANAFMLYLMQISGYVFPLITFPYITRVMGSSIYGQITFVSSTMAYFSMLVDFGFILSGTKKIAQIQNDQIKIQKETANILYSKVFLGICGFFLLIPVVLGIEAFSSIRLFTLLSYAPVFLSALIPDYFFRGMENMTAITTRTIFSKIVYTLCIFLFVNERSDFLLLPIINSASTLFTVIWSWFYIKKKYGFLSLPFSFSGVFGSIRNSFYFFTSRLASTLYGASNTFLLGIVFSTTPEIVALYGVASVIINTGRAFLSPISDSVYPYVVRTKKIKIVKKILFIFMPLILGGVILVYFLSDWVILVLCGEGYSGASPILRLQLPIVLITLPTYLLGFPVMGALGIIKKANSSVVIGSIFHGIGLLFLLVTDSFSIVSVSILTCITEMLVLLIRVIFVYRERKKQKNAISPNV